MLREFRVKGIPGIPEVRPGDPLASLIVQAVRQNRVRVRKHDVLVVAQKIVSKAEGCIQSLKEITPSSRATRWAARFHKDARVVEVVLREARRIVKMERGVIIAETRHGFVCANAGVDASNTAPEMVTLLPPDPDGSAEGLRRELEQALDRQLAVVISDTFGRPWREGLVNVALGVAGMDPFLDYRGQTDSAGRPLRVTRIAVADEVASAAELVMGKTGGVPVALVSGLFYTRGAGAGQPLVRPPEKDLFRGDGEEP